MTIGAAAGLAVADRYFLSQDNATLLMIVGVAIVASALPDIDHANSLISHKARPARLLFRWFKHRGFTHSLYALFLITIIAGELLPYPIALSLALGYGSHIMADMLTRDGVLFLWPLQFRCGLPRIVSIKTGGWLEFIIWIMAMLLCFYLATTILGGEMAWILACCLT